MDDIVNFGDYDTGKIIEIDKFKLAGLFYANIMDTEMRLKIATHVIFPKLMKNWVEPNFNPLGMYTTIGKILKHLRMVGSINDSFANTLERVANLRNAFMHWSVDLDGDQSENGVLWGKLKMADEGKISNDPNGKPIKIGGYQDLMEIRRYLDAAGLAFLILENRPDGYLFENEEKRLAARKYFPSVGTVWGFDMNQINRNLKRLKMTLPMDND